MKIDSLSSPSAISSGHAGARWRYAAARRCMALATVSAAALVVLPNGLSLFALLLLVSTLLVADFLVAAWSQAGASLKASIWLVLAVVSVCAFSAAFWGLDWDSLDNPSRLLLMPWCAGLVYAVGVSRFGLWAGAVFGVLLSFGIALWQTSTGLDRADSGGNPIVFANIVLALLVLAICCRPPMRRRRSLALLATVLTLGAATIVLTGSRGALPGLAALLLTTLAGGTGRMRWLRLALSVAVPALLFAALWNVPELSSQARLEGVPKDLARYERGDADSPIGARLQLLTLAGSTFADHPWTGVGIGRFGAQVDRLPGCRQEALGLCVLNHAHNDLAEWAATMGIPGLLAILALYLVPLTLFVRIIRHSGRQASARTAWAGAMVVVVYFFSGLTQSMFAHASSATAYAIFIGVLLGASLLESRAGTRDQVGSRRG